MYRATIRHTLSAPDVSLRPSRGWPVIGLLAGLAAAWVATSSLFNPYSYWLDELFSINLSRLSFRDMHAVLLNDVHPPLYQVLLKLWMKVSGASEPATRLFSALCALTAIGLLWRHARAFGPIYLVCAVSLFASSKLLIFYANETRGYALTVLCSMAVTLSAPRPDRRAASVVFALSCLALSLTHYFGLIYVAAVLGLCLLDAVRAREGVLRLLLIGATCLAWPIHHLLNGAVLTKTGGTFWIVVHGVQDSLSIAGTALSPVWSGPLGTQGSASSAAGPVLVLAIVVAMALAQAGRRSPVARDATLAALAMRMGAASLLLLATVALIDLHTPMSTVRNVIVLLPPLTVLGACSVKVLAQSRPRLQWALMLGLSAVCSLSIWTAAQAIGSKSLPRQDWKGAVAALAPHAATRALHVGTYGLIVDHYFRQHGLDAAHARPWKAGQTALAGPAALIYGHLDSQQYARLLTDMRALGARRIHPAHEPQDGFAPGVYLID